jgi:hypothetical protein
LPTEHGCCTHFTPACQSLGLLSWPVTGHVLTVSSHPLTACPQVVLADIAVGKSIVHVIGERNSTQIASCPCRLRCTCAALGRIHSNLTAPCSSGSQHKLWLPHNGILM